jgi:maleamate amidohydrolase
VTSGKEDEEFFRQRGFGIRMGFGERPALIVIDMINGFTDPAMPLGANLDGQIAAQKLLLEVAHERAVPVLFSTVVYEEADMKDAGIWALKQTGPRTLTAGSEAVKVDARLDMQPSDILLVKKYASCFFGTDLVLRLNSRRIDTLIITGCTTSGCVRATAVDAVQNGFRPMVVREAVGDRSVAAHDQSLFDLNAKYADVVSLDETLQYLKTVVPQPARGLSVRTSDRPG